MTTPWKVQKFFTAFFVLLSCIIIFLAMPAANADETRCKIEGDFDGDSTELGGRHCAPDAKPPIETAPLPLPGTPPGSPTDPKPSDPETPLYIYWDQIACSDAESNLDPICLGSAPTCKDGESLLQTWRILNKPDQDPRTAQRVGSPRCVGPHDPALPRPDEDPVVTLEDFQRLTIISANIGVQPRPHTLIRAHNNFYAEVETQTFNITLLNKAVEVRAMPVSYTWNYGDGTTRGPMPEAGIAIHETDLGEHTFTSYAYQETGDYNIQLTTYFRGEFSVEGGPWQAIRGQAQVASEPVTMSVWRSESRLVDGTCAENPEDWGC